MATSMLRKEALQHAGQLLPKRNYLCLNYKRHFTAGPTLLERAKEQYSPSFGNHSSPSNNWKETRLKDKSNFRPIKTRTLDLDVEPADWRVPPNESWAYLRPFPTDPTIANFLNSLKPQNWKGPEASLIAFMEIPKSETAFVLKNMNRTATQFLIKNLDAGIACRETSTMGLVHFYEVAEENDVVLGRISLNICASALAYKGLTEKAANLYRREERRMLTLGEFGSQVMESLLRSIMNGAAQGNQLDTAHYFFDVMLKRHKPSETSTSLYGQRDKTMRSVASVLIGALLRAERFSEAKAVRGLLSNMDIAPDAQTYIDFLAYFTKHDQTEQRDDMLQVMKKQMLCYLQNHTQCS